MDRRCKSLFFCLSFSFFEASLLWSLIHWIFSPLLLLFFLLFGHFILPVWTRWWLFVLVRSPVLETTTSTQLALEHTSRDQPETWRMWQNLPLRPWKKNCDRSWWPSTSDADCWDKNDHELGHLAVMLQLASWHGAIFWGNPPSWWHCL